MTDSETPQTTLVEALVVCSLQRSVFARLRRFVGDDSLPRLAKVVGGLGRHGRFTLKIGPSDCPIDRALDGSAVQGIAEADAPACAMPAMEVRADGGRLAVEVTYGGLAVRTDCGPTATDNLFASGRGPAPPGKVAFGAACDSFAASVGFARAFRTLRQAGFSIDEASAARAALWTPTSGELTATVAAKGDVRVIVSVRREGTHGWKLYIGAISPRRPLVCPAGRPHTLRGLNQEALELAFATAAEMSETPSG